MLILVEGFVIVFDFLGKYKAILDFIGKDKDILDVGCSDGYISSLLKQQGNRIVGVEIVKARVENAKKYCKEIIVGDVEDSELLNRISNKFDVILYSEVLEHTKNPLQVLKNQKGFLKKDGFVIVLLPNVAYWKNRLSLLFGNWRYTQQGILDKTHLRFFTLKTTKDLIRDAGYLIINVKVLYHKKVFYNFIKSLLVKIFPGLFGIVFIIKAEPK